MNAFITKEGNGRGNSNAYIDGVGNSDVGANLFERGLCLPSDIKMGGGGTGEGNRNYCGVLWDEKTKIGNSLTGT